MPESGISGDEGVRPAGTTAGGPPGPVGNADCRWDLFDSFAYLERNYSTLHDLDRAIIARLGKFFASLAPTSGWHGIDVGPGTNLYPAMAMMPLVDTIMLWEYSAANVAWLERETNPYARSWNQFWDALAASADIYSQVRRPTSTLSGMTKIEKASIFDLPEAKWDIGTMFFVAESITGRLAEFELGTEKFIRSLKPGAPFAAAFMENSLGYLVGERRFPAVFVTECDIRRALCGLVTEYQIHHIASRQQFRQGYDGMILVTGTRQPTVYGQRGRDLSC